MKIVFAIYIYAECVYTAYIYHSDIKLRDKWIQFIITIRMLGIQHYM